MLKKFILQGVNFVLNQDLYAIAEIGTFNSDSVVLKVMKGLQTSMEDPKAIDIKILETCLTGGVCNVLSFESKGKTNMKVVSGNTLLPGPYIPSLVISMDAEICVSWEENLYRVKIL